MCGLCHTKPITTCDSFVGTFGVRFGIDGQGNGKEEFARNWEGSQLTRAAEQLDAQQ
jgi:hypothetical protein